MRFALLSGVAGFILATTGAAHADLPEEIEAIKAKYQPQLESLQEQARKLSANKPTDFESVIGYNVELERKEFKFDIPEVTVKQQDWILGVPEFYTGTVTVAKFHVPETFIGTTEIGRTGIKIDVPQVRSVLREIKTDLPQVRMVQQQWHLGVPEFKMTTVEVSFDIPTIESTDATVENMKDEGARIEREAVTVAAAMTAEINVAVVKELVAKRADIAQKFEASIADLRAQRAANESREGFQAQVFDSAIATMEAQRVQVLADLDTKIAQFAVG